MFKLGILGVVLLVLAGCSTASQRGGKANYPEVTSQGTKAPVETEHITEAPRLAPPPVTAPVMPATTDRFANMWIPFRRWSEENKIGPVQKLSSGSVPTFALKASNGLLIFRAYDLVSYWNGMELHLGFTPQIVNGEPALHSLDISKNIQPLLHPGNLPEKTNRVIVVDPGHGGSNLGTKSVVDGAYEKEFTLDWAKRLVPILETNGWKVLLTRTSDEDISLSNRVTFADACKADLFISLHFNAAPLPTDNEESGIETFCLTPTGMPSTLTREYDDDVSLVYPNNRFDTENLQYAMRVQRSLLKIAGAHDHGVRRARFMGVLRGQNRPAILVEGGYLSNPREARRIADPAYRQKLAEAVAAALVEPSKAQSPKPAVQTPTPPTNSAPNP